MNISIYDLSLFRTTKGHTKDQSNEKAAGALVRQSREEGAEKGSARLEGRLELYPGAWITHGSDPQSDHPLALSQNEEIHLPVPT